MKCVCVCGGGGGGGGGQEGSPFQNKSKNLDPSYKMDLYNMDPDSLVYFGRKTPS